MGALVHAADVLFSHLAAVAWGWVALALALHLAKIACRTRAERSILAAAYPNELVRWRHVFGAYVSGVAVNAVVPARGGDVLRLVILRRRIRGASYPALVSALAVETLFDLAVALGLFVWAVERGMLPGLDILPYLRDIDASWFLRHPIASVAIVASVAALATVAGLWASRRVAGFTQRLKQGLAVLGDRRRYLRSVATWQAADWLFRLATIACFLEAFGIAEGLSPRAWIEGALLVQVAQSLSTLLPFTPGGLGTSQALVVYVLAGEVSTGALLTFSVGMDAVLMLANAALGFGAIFLMLRTLRFRRLVEREGRALAGPRAAEEERAGTPTTRAR